MKALDRSLHLEHLNRILLNIYQDSNLAASLAFKGGTAAMLFYKLPRFSVDLDFDLIGDSSQVIERMTRLLRKDYKIVDSNPKYHTLLWVVSYGVGFAHIKIEINTRDVSYNHYEMVNYYGASVRMMKIGDMIAHKLIAVKERLSMANRDLFDAHYFLSTSYATEINYDIIKSRLGKEPKEFWTELREFVQKVDERYILNGLGELLTESQKDWGRTKLKSELLQLIEMRIDWT